MLRLHGPGPEYESMHALDDEDPFTLETLGSLADAHSKARRPLVVARVTTRDRSNPMRTGCFIYSAAHLNRLLYKGFNEEAPVGPVTTTPGGDDAVTPGEPRDGGSDSESGTVHNTDANPSANPSANPPSASRRGLRFRVSRHRYHRTDPITVLDPMTNTEIVGEVMYFRVRSPAGGSGAVSGNGGSSNNFSATPSSSSAASPMAFSRANAVAGAESASLLLPGSVGDTAAPGLSSGNDRPEASIQTTTAAAADIDADFIGTDYSFVHSETVRDAIVAGALDVGDARIAEVAQIRVRDAGGDNPVALGADGTPMDGAELLGVLQRLAPMIDAAHGGRGGWNRSDAIDVPFSRAVVFGAVGTLYLIITFLIFSAAALHLMARDTERGTYWYFIFVVPLSFATDHVISAMFLSHQRRDLVVTKIFAGAAYILLPLIMNSGGTRSDSGSSYWLARDLLDVTIPPALMIYTCSVYIYFSIDKRLL